MDLLVESLEDVVGLLANLKLVHVGRGDAVEGVPHHEELEAGGAGGGMEVGSGLWPEPLSGRVKICHAYLKERVSHITEGGTERHSLVRVGFAFNSLSQKRNQTPSDKAKRTLGTL